MRRRTVSPIVGALLLSACAGHSGVYSPDCLAHEGDTIVLLDGRYEWRHFTDQIVIGDDGNPVDAPSGYPRYGVYSIAQDRVELSADTNGAVSNFTLMREDGGTYLLTGDEIEVYTRTGEMPDCVLKRE